MKIGVGVRVHMLAKRFFSACRVYRKTPLIVELKSRGLLSQLTSDALENEAEKTKLGVYLGADPTADSLHLGNLLPFMVLMHFYIRGHDVFPLIGGATGIVGDPSGRKTERELMLAKQRDDNVAKISAQMKQILENCRSVAAKHTENSVAGNIKPVNNRTWWENVNMLWFLGTFGRHFRVNAMISRDSVKQRLNSDSGIGYNEFSYQILQAYDFYHLYKHHNCRIQIGGHDQWGNIVSGVDLINRLRDTKQESEPLGLTVPLLLTPSGEKFGKSAGNAVFLSAERTSPYHLFQHLIQSPDEAVEHYLKVFTFVPLEQIEQVMIQHNQQPEKRAAQYLLASEVTELIHGPEQTRAAQTISSVVFGNADRSDTDVLEAFKSQNLTTQMQLSDLVGKPWRSLLADLSKRSKSESQRLIKGNSVYIGLNRTPLKSNTVESGHISTNGLLLIRIGKSEYYVVEALPN